ncbi:MAG TPA: sugar phosphate isomerase/epimerase family protein [Candidatus Sulfotelmatobacter sp.]|nr:sugar phosphate isomerase/epimerase family protein [Candidatus Sulfotelmatobacter sp.]
MVTRRTFLTAAAAAIMCPGAWARTRDVKIGVCTRDIAGAAKFGFDYIEPGAAEIAGMSEDEFREFSDAVLASPIRCHAFNSFIRRPDLKVVGPEVHTSALQEYLEACLPRCRHLGASIVVWGSAGSRNVPEGFSPEKARDQIAAFLRMAGEVARRSDIIVAIEPLRRQESNILNTGAEALEMVRRVNHSSIRMIIDYFHLREENEDPRIIETAKREIVHLHFANPHGRVWPRDLTEDDHYAAFFRYLKKTRYSGRISIEGQGSFEKDGKASLEFFRRALIWRKM